MSDHEERVERIAKDIIRFVRENERAENFKDVLNDPALVPHSWERVEKNILDCLWAVYHMKGEKITLPYSKVKQAIE